jgi:hypothetical protein
LCFYFYFVVTALYSYDAPGWTTFAWG